MVRHGVCPDRSAALVVSVIEKAFRRMQVAGIDDELPGSFVIRVWIFAKQPAVSDEKWHAHEHAVKPKLVLAACAGGMPESAVAGTRISVEALPDFVCGQFVFFFFRLLIHEKQKIAGKHGVQRIQVVINVALSVHVRINPAFYVLKIAGVAGPFPDHVFTYQKESASISPGAEFGGIGVTLHGGVNNGL